MKTAYTIAATTVPSLQNSYEEGDSMQPDENNIRSREFPFLLTTDSVILKPKILTEDSVLRSDNSLTDSSKSVWVVSETVTEYVDLIHRTDISEKKNIQIQTDFQPYSLDSIIPSINSITFTTNSTDEEADSTSTVERKTINISKVKTDVRMLDTIMNDFFYLDKEALSLLI